MPEQVLDDFEDNWSNWALDGPNNDGLAAIQESSIVQVGSSSINLRVDASLTAFNEGAWVNTSENFDVSAITGVSSGAPTQGEMKVWIYANNLSELDQIQFWFGNNGSNVTRFGELTVADTALTEDTWVEITADLTTGTTAGTPDWTAMDFMRIQTDHQAGATDYNVYFDQLRFISGIFTKELTGDTISLVEFLARQPRKSMLDRVEVSISNKNVIDDFEADWEDWVEGIDGENPVQETTIVKRGDSSIHFGIDASLNGADFARWTKTHSPTLDLSSYVGVSTGFPTQGIVRMWVYVDTISFLDRVTIAFLDANTWGAQYEINVSDITPGSWNLLNVDMTDIFFEFNTGSADWTAINRSLITVEEISSNTTDFECYIDELLVADTSESLVRDATKVLTDTITLNETIIKAIQKGDFADVIALVDEATIQRSKELSDAFTVTEATVIKGPGKSIADAITVFDATNKEFFSTLGDIFSLAEELTKQATKEGLSADTISIIEAAVEKVSEKTLADIITLNEIFGKGTLMDLSDTITLDAIAGRAMEQNLIEAITITDVVSKELKEFLNEMQADFDTILSDVPFEDEVTWVRNANVEDPMGREASTSETFSQVMSLMIQPITEKDRDITALGISISGHMKAYARHQYETSVGKQAIKTGDFLTASNDDEYIVEKIIGIYNGKGTEIYRKLILREVDNG